MKDKSFLTINIKFIT